MGYKLREQLSEILDKAEKEGRHIIRRGYLRRNIKRYIKKPYVLTHEQMKAAKAYWGGTQSILAPFGMSFMRRRPENSM